MIEEMRLGVNVDHVATLRQARGTIYPDPVKAALIAEKAGAHQITVHLREDRRHIQERDVVILKEMLEIDLNFEMAITEEMLTFAKTIRPTYACLVPENRHEITTEGGLDVISHFDAVRDAVHTLQDNEIQVSLFVDADQAQIEHVFETGARIIELHTGQYADAASESERLRHLDKIAQCAEFAQSMGIRVHAGHGLHYRNTADIALIEAIVELNIGHAIVAQALFVGMHAAVEEMLDVIHSARGW